MENITNLDITALSSLLLSKKVSAKEVTEAYIEKIKVKNKELGAYITICEERAFADAKKAQERIDNGSADTLTGIPIALKDNICTKDIKTTCASRMLENFVPPYNATVTERLEKQGTVLLGKTNMDEFAMGNTSQTSYFGGVKNPINTEYVPGGSSGGSAAAVAAGLCAAALGSDTGGSVRQPSAFCGVTGLKPTYGTVSRYGLVAFASSLDQIGPIARSARDCAMIFDAIKGIDTNDATTKAPAAGSALCKFDIKMQDITIGLPVEFFGEGISDEVKTAVLKAAKIYEALGCQLKEVSLPSLKYAVPSYLLISSAEAASNLSRFDGIKYGYRSEIGDSYEELIKNTRREGFGDEVKRRIMLGNYALCSGYYEAYYSKAVQVRAKLKSEYNEMFSACSCILTPTAPTAAYKIKRLDNDPSKLYSGDIYTTTANIVGIPSVSTNCGYNAEGMPIGMSISGRSFDEALILAVADRYEREVADRNV